MLIWERYAPVFALAGVLVSIFLIGSFGGVWQRFGDPWRLFVLLAMLILIFRAVLHARSIRFPTRSQAQRRVETDSNVRHRPLDTLDDRPVLGGQAWPPHFENAVAKAQSLNPPRFRPALAPIDPYFLRIGLPVAIGLAFMVGFGDNFERFRHAFSPSWQSGMSAGNASFEVWADPPDYTGRPPIYFKDKDLVNIPAGSKLVARVSGLKDAPRLKLSTNRRNRYLPLERLGADSFETTAIINERSTARWRIGTYERSWTLNAIKDKPPVVSINDAPKADRRDRLSVTYYFEDDYGVEELYLEVNRLSEYPDIAAVTETIQIPLSGASVRKADYVTSALDLTKHKWAAEKVTARLIAKDGLGQSASSEPVYFTIPDKIFVEPLAKSVIEHRKLVMAGNGAYGPLPKFTRREWADKPWFDTFDTDNRLGRAPAEIQRAAVLIDAVTDRPEDIFRDPAVYMGLKNILGRLRYAKSADALTGIPDELWSIAIRAEFGVLGTALEEMREAEQALRDGIARRAPKREIDTLFDRYDEAVDRYMEELRRKAMEEGNFAQNDGGGGGGGQNMDEIQALLDAIEEANRLGDTEGARLALARLAELLENMQIQLAMGGGGEGEGMPGEMSEEMKKALEELADLLGEQRELQDETQQAENEALRRELEDSLSQPGGTPGEESEDGEQAGSGSLSPEELAERQSAIEEMLEGLREGMAEGGEPFPEFSEDGEGAGNPNESLDEAERAMERSAEALGQGDFNESQDAQREAIEALRQAGQAIAEQAEGQDGESSQEASNGDDPLGRSDGGENDPNAEADLEQRDNAKRSRELLKELRRRAAEQEREKEEREYLDRLLKRF